MEFKINSTFFSSYAFSYAQGISRKKVRIRQFDQVISLKENMLSVSPVITQMPGPQTGFHIYQMPWIESVTGHVSCVNLFTISR